VRKLFVLLGLGLVVLAASCETLNIGNGNPIKGPANVQITVPANIVAGGTGTFSATWQGGIGATTVTWDFNAAVTADPAPTANATPPATATVTFVGSTTAATAGTLTVTVTDSNGQSATGTATFSVPLIPNVAPTITLAANNAACTVTATVHDDDGDDVTVEATTVAAAFNSNTGVQTISGDGTHDFSFSALDVLAGGTGDITFTATDTFNNVVTATTTLTCAGITLAADTIYAIPTASSIAAGSNETIVVATGVPANPFQYLTGTRVTIDQSSGALYVGGTAAAGGTADVPGSFNAGAVGGTAGDVDGFWTCMAPASFLLPPDNFIQRSDAGGGLYGFDFNLTPLGGADVTTCEGALFNFQLQVPNAGTYTLGFQDVNTVSRTYYQDGNQTPDYFWGDFSNNHVADGAPNSFTVN